MLMMVCLEFDAAKIVYLVEKNKKNARKRSQRMYFWYISDLFRAFSGVEDPLSSLKQVVKCDLGLHLAPLGIMHHAFGGYHYGMDGAVCLGCCGKHLALPG